MRQGRVFVGLCILSILWIVLYWMWDAPAVDSPVARVTFANAPEPRHESADHAPAPDDTTPHPQAAPPSAGVIAPEFDTYTVGSPGETWASISLAVYGTPDHAAALSDANPYVAELTPGREIRVPKNPANTRGIVVEPPPDEPKSDPTGPRIIAEHVVQPGEVLGTISAKYYGTSSKYMVIYEFNRERLGLESPNVITPGDTLLIPAIDDK
jgi:nucleoid-associated protein YgaU